MYPYSFLGYPDKMQKNDKMQIGQNAKILNINNPKYSILGVPIENQCVKGGGLLYGGTVYFYNAAVSLVKLPLVIHSYVGVNQIFLQVMSFFKLESDDGCFQRKNIFRINLRDFPI